MSTRETCEHHVDFLNLRSCPDCAQKTVHARREALIARAKAALDAVSHDASEGVVMPLSKEDLRSLLSLAETSSPFPAAGPYRTSSRPVVPAAKAEPEKRSVNLSKQDLAQAVRAWVQDKYGAVPGQWTADCKIDDEGAGAAFIVSWTKVPENDQGM